MGEVLKDIRAMAVEVALGDYGGLREWKFAWINDTLPDQAPKLNPYDKLLVAVLIDAITLLKKAPPKPSLDREANRHRRARESAARWVKSNRDDYCMDFVPICEHFGWSPSLIRKKIGKLIEKKLPVGK